MLIACFINWINTTSPMGWLLSLFLTWLYSSDKCSPAVPLSNCNVHLTEKANNDKWLSVLPVFIWLGIADFISSHKWLKLDSSQESWSCSLKKTKKSLHRGFNSGALCGAVRSYAARLLCFLNYPYWIHYLFALLNLLNLAALQQKNI